MCLCDVCALLLPAGSAKIIPVRHIVQFFCHNLCAGISFKGIFVVCRICPFTSKDSDSLSLTIKTDDVLSGRRDVMVMGGPGASGLMCLSCSDL